MKRNIPNTVRDRILGKLDSGESLSNVDFRDLGYSFDHFLRYGQCSPEQTTKAHTALRTMLGTA